MKITVIGGSGGTGAAFTTAALAAGHDVTVVSRSGRAPQGARVVPGDATEGAVLDRALAGADAVVVTVGGAKGVKHGRTAVTRAVLDGMRRHGVRRILVQSSLGTHGSADRLAPPMNRLAPVLLAVPLADHNRQEDAVRASGLDWTVVRPSGLKDGPATGSATVLRDGVPGRVGGTVQRADVAACLLAALQDEGTVGTCLAVGS